MFLVDYHMHSKLSFDGTEAIEDMANRAVKKGLSEIAVTDHIELGNGIECQWNKMIKNVFTEIDSVQKKQDKLIIRKGIELGNPHLESCNAQKICQEFRGDFIIGSVHNLVENQDVWYYDFRHMDCEKFICEYMDVLGYVAENYDYDVLGHITYPFKGMYQQRKEVPNLAIYKKQLQTIFKIVVKRNKGIEINTSGLRVAWKNLLPQTEVLRLYKECGGTYVTVGSDAHTVADVGEGIWTAMKTIRDIGFEYITTYEKHIPIQHKLIVKEE